MIRAVWTALVILSLLAPLPALARTKLVAVPERAEALIRLDNPRATLIEEERTLTLQEGANQVDFAWNGVSIDPDSIRLAVLSHPDSVTLLSVSYPPGEPALVWDLHARAAAEVKVRISYLLNNIDRLTAYKGLVDGGETSMRLFEFLVIRNFSGEDFAAARAALTPAKPFDLAISHEETLQKLVAETPVPVEKVWTFDAARLPWDPEKVDGNAGIPVAFRLANKPASGLGKAALWPGKMRVFMDQGQSGSLFLGEDDLAFTPVGEDAEVNIGDSRDIVVTQRKMSDRRINVRRNKSGRVVLYDTDEVITAKIENFKDKEAVLTMIQHIPGEWDMEEASLPYKKKDNTTLVFEIRLPARGKAELTLHYHRRNLRG